jgi:hypothetical protein
MENLNSAINYSQTPRIFNRKQNKRLYVTRVSGLQILQNWRNIPPGKNISNEMYYVPCKNTGQINWDEIKDVYQAHQLVGWDNVYIIIF